MSRASHGIGKQAKRAGGRVHVLIANHEAMNLVGLLDYVSDGSLRHSPIPTRQDFDSELFEHHYKEQKERAKGEGEPAPPKDEARKASNPSTSRLLRTPASL